MEGEALMPLSGASHPLERKNSHGSGSNIALQHQGEEDTLEFRIHAVEPAQKKVISLWHDISLTHIDPITGLGTPYLNFVCEIPKFTR